MDVSIRPGLKAVFVVHFVVGLVFGLGYLIVPQMVGNIFGHDAADPAWRIVGAAMIGFGMSSWWGFRAISWEQVRIIVEAEVVWTLLAAIVVAWVVMMNMMPPIGWLMVAIFLIFAVAFGYYLATSGRTVGPVSTTAQGRGVM